MMLRTRAAIHVQVGLFPGFRCRWLALLSGDGTYIGARVEKLEAS